MVKYKFLAYIKKILAVAHVWGGFTSVFIVGMYVYYGVAATVILFDPMSQGILPSVRMAIMTIVGLAMVVGLHVGNALACFFVAYSLWKPREWGRRLVFYYDGFVFLGSLAILAVPLYAPTTPRPFFLWFIAGVLLISGSTILVCIRPSRPPV